MYHWTSVAKSRLRSRAREGAPSRRYVASLIWQERLPTTANDNGRASARHHLLPLAASLALILAVVWALVS